MFRMQYFTFAATRGHRLWLNYGRFVMKMIGKCVKIEDFLGAVHNCWEILTNFAT